MSAEKKFERRSNYFLIKDYENKNKCNHNFMFSLKTAKNGFTSDQESVSEKLAHIKTLQWI